MCIFHEKISPVSPVILAELAKISSSLRIQSGGRRPFIVISASLFESIDFSGPDGMELFPK
jgi:hypothetical protein